MEGGLEVGPLHTAFMRPKRLQPAHYPFVEVKTRENLHIR